MLIGDQYIRLIQSLNSNSSRFWSVHRLQAALCPKPININLVLIGNQSNGISLIVDWYPKLRKRLWVACSIRRVYLISQMMVGIMLKIMAKMMAKTMAVSFVQYRPFVWSVWTIHLYASLLIGKRSKSADHLHYVCFIMKLSFANFDSLIGSTHRLAIFTDTYWLINSMLKGNMAELSGTILVPFELAFLSIVLNSSAELETQPNPYRSAKPTESFQ